MADNDATKSDAPGPDAKAENPIQVIRDMDHRQVRFKIPRPITKKQLEMRDQLLEAEMAILRCTMGPNTYKPKQ
jgi:hypothetical protein